MEPTLALTASAKGLRHVSQVLESEHIIAELP